jgi:hypothetical protein
MPVLGYGLGDRESVLAQRFHKCKLFHRRQPRHVHPRARVAVAQVVAVCLDGSERNAAETVDFQDALGAAAVCHDHDVGFLAHADLVADGVDAFLFLVRVQCEVVESTVGKAVAIICTGKTEGQRLKKSFRISLENIRTFCIFDLGDQVRLRQSRNRLVHPATTPQAG